MKHMTKIRQGLGLGILLMALAAFVGCQDSASNSGATALGSAVPGTDGQLTGFNPPSIDDLADELNLTDEQKTEMEAALTALNTAMEEQRAERQQNRQNRQPGERPGRFNRPDGPPPMHTFLVTSADILDNDQLVALIEFLEEHRQERRQQLQGQRGQGRGPGQHGMRGEGHGFMQRHLEEMADQLELTDEQIEQLRAAHQEMRESIRELMQQNPGRPDEATREQMRALHESMRETMESILTPEQLEQLEAIRDERHEERSAERQANFAERQERHLDFLTNVLGLTDSQRDQIESIMMDAHEQMVELHEQMRDRDADREALRDQAQEIRENAAASILAVLDEDQAKIFEALKDLMPGRGGPGGRGPGHGPGGRGFRFGR